MHRVRAGKSNQLCESVLFDEKKELGVVEGQNPVFKYLFVLSLGS